MSNSREQTTSALIERMGLSHDPFATAVDGFFFVGGQRRFLVQQAVHALYFASGIVLLSGAQGAGKSRIVDEVCRELAELVDICRLDASVLMDINGVRQHLADSLGLAIDAADESSLLAALAQLQPETGDPLPVLLAIDDAQQLAVPVLQGCRQLASASAGRIRLLLAGAPELLAAWEQVGDFSVDQLDVLPLDAQEAVDYVATRLQAAGYRGESPLSEIDQQDLYRQTRGNIAAIHELAPSVLLTAVGGGELPDQRRGLPWPHLAIVACLVVVVGVTAWFWRGTKSNESVAIAPTALPASTSPPANLGARTAVPLAVPAPKPVAEVTEPSAPVSTTAPIQGQIQTPVLVETAVSKAPPAPVAKAVMPVAAVAIEPKSPAVQPQKITPKTPEAAKPVTKPVTKPVAVPATKSSESAQPVAEAAKPLAALPANQFVLQLIAADSKAGRDKFLAVAAKGLKVYTYEARRDGKPRYLAVLGPYADKNAARAAISGLPKALRDQNPWLRSVASVQADLHAK